ncbi:unnamed protein product [Hermetia illucens]|uniref:Uncharacterized protein n=1 Tax=Hermetia illucens TaxID=343691 RepID=A0A7R8UC92_HERIL|nr:unnamed protein product [Hermetia illucens]
MQIRRHPRSWQKSIEFFEGTSLYVVPCLNLQLITPSSKVRIRNNTQVGHYNKNVPNRFDRNNLWEGELFPDRQSSPLSFCHFIPNSIYH